MNSSAAPFAKSHLWCFPAALQLTLLIAWRLSHVNAQTQKCASTFCAVCAFTWLNWKKCIDKYCISHIIQ